MRTNIPYRNTAKTYEGAPAIPENAEKQLRRSVMACMLWEGTFYESGQTIAERIRSLIPHVDPQKVVNMAIEARSTMNLRHVPLLIAREMARLEKHKAYVANLLNGIIQRADELTEFLAIYWAEKRQPLSAQVKKGLAKAFTKFTEFQLAKYNRGNKVKLRDVLFLSHAKPVSDEQAAVWKRLVNGEIGIPDTWEVAISATKDKKGEWERLLKENRLGGMAFLRNLRNMNESRVDEKLIMEAFKSMKTDRILPFRYVASARYAPQWEPQIEEVMLKSLEEKQKLQGKTILLIDVSGSMDALISSKSEMRAIDAACGLAILAREICENVSIFTFSNHLVPVPPRRGFALRDAIVNSQEHSETYIGQSISSVNSSVKTNPHDRIIVFTDEQSHDEVPAPTVKKAYMVNISSYEHGVGYGSWTRITGFSESIMEYIRMNEDHE